jgi:lysophospholipase L1-like esterase/pimeloyl-ACP methyl ester carboxylesterase
VLVLGDSISIGYTPFLTKQLAKVADVVRPMTADGRPENCSGTKNGIAKVDDWIARVGKPDVITFNFGLHDLKRETAGSRRVASNDPADPPQSDPETYRRNLIQIVTRLEATGAKLFFVTTTPVPPGGVKPHRDLGDPLLYNGIARQVVEPRGIEVIDLHAVAAAKPDWMRPANVHFTDEGSEALATAIAKPVRAALADLDHAKRSQVVPAEAKPWEADSEVVERASKNRSFNYREEDVPNYELPDPLLNPDGDRVGAQQWPEHREQTLQLFRDHVYGNVPAEADEATITYKTLDQYNGLHVSASQIEFRVTAHESDFTFPVLVYLPKQAQGPVPAIVMIHNREFPDLAGAIERPSPFIPVEPIVKRGYAVAIFHTSHVDPDRKDGFDAGIRGFFARVKHGADAGISSRGPTDWGSLSAWAWGASRVLDYLETLPQIDAKRVAVIGHSRGGKTSAWTAASDTRFAAAMVNESGCGGAALSRRRYGETISRITTAFPHWFCKQLNDYADREDDLPVDQHQLMGLIAPRAVVVASAAEDLWADPKGEYLSLYYARPVFSLLGQQSIDQETMPPLAQPRFVGATGYFIRPGTHGLHEGDWANYLDFLDAQSLDAQ